MIHVSYSSFVTKWEKDLATNLSFEVSDECQNEFVSIESFYACFTRRYKSRITTESNGNSENIPGWSTNNSKI